MKKHTFMSKKFSVSFLLTLFLSAHLISCQDDIDGQREYPRVKTLDVVNIDSTGASFRGEIFTEGNQPITEHGFVWGTYERGLNINNDSEKVSLGSFDGIGTFEARIPTTLETGRKYYVKAYLKSGDFTVYGQSVDFVSLGSSAPVIEDFEPKTANWGDSIRLFGKNFWNSPSLKVLFGNIIAQKKGFNEKDSSVWAIVPNEVGELKNRLSIEIEGNSSSSKDSFLLIPPAEIYFFEPLIGTWGDTITITGNFPLIHDHKVFFNDKRAQIIDNGIDFLRVKVPDGLTSSSVITNKVGSYTVSAKESFDLKKPVIEKFSANRCPPGIPISIHGDYFKNGITKVFFGINEVSILSVTKNTINIKVPNIPDGNMAIKVVVGEQEVVSPENFTIANPKIVDFYPKTATFSDIITITGNNLLFDFAESSITINGVIQDIYSNSNSEIKFKVSNEVTKQSANISYIVGGSTTRSTDLFTLLPPEIASFTPTTGGTNPEITILGNNFNPQADRNNITIGHTDASVNFSSKNEIRVNADLPLRGYYNLKLSMNGYQTEVDQLYSCVTDNNSAWGYIAGPSITGYGKACVIGDFAYLFITESIDGGRDYINRLLKFDPNNIRWEEVPIPQDFKSKESESAVFAINKTIYIVGGKEYPYSYSNRVVSWNSETNTWTRLNDFPGSDRVQANVLNLNGRVYLMGGGNNSGAMRDMWEYDSVNDTWTRKNDSSLYYSSDAFEYNNKGYAFFYDDQQYKVFLYEYDSDTDSWSKYSAFPGNPGYSIYSFVIGSKVYTGHYLYGTGYSDELWEFDFETQQWLKRETLELHRDYGVYFTYKNKGFVGFGTSPENGFRTDIYEYDPTLEP